MLLHTKIHIPGVFKSTLESTHFVLKLGFVNKRKCVVLICVFITAYIGNFFNPHAAQTYALDFMTVMNEC